jgi:hypothetical protein
MTMCMGGVARRGLAVLVMCAAMAAMAGCSSTPGSNPNPSSDCVGPDDEDAARQAQTDPAPSCTPQPVCPHKGGNERHNRCADRSGNVAWDGQLLTNDQLPSTNDPPAGSAGLGCDVALGKRDYDAMSWDWRLQHRRLWEVKTNDWSNSYKYDDHLKACTFRRMVERFREDCLQVLTCNKDIAAEEDKFTYVLGFSDAGLYYAVVDYFVNAGNYEREIMSQVRALGLTDDPRVYCTIENLQRCR